MIELVLGTSTVLIDAGELVGFRVNGFEYIHQKGNPGWRNSDTEMFPIIGPTSEAGFKVNTSKGFAVQDQHGLLRELHYKVLSQSSDKVIFEKEYIANTKVNNSKYPDKSLVKELFWPFSFKFQKSFHVKKDGLHIQFNIEGDEKMPIMLGYHPAFDIKTKNAEVRTADQSIGIPQIIDVGSRAMQILDCERITLLDEKELVIHTQGFGHFMLWTEVPNMLCIEPITFYPYEVEQKDLSKGFDFLNDKPKTFSVHLEPVK